ncbi:MAG: alpha/beta fold hydrolase [Clostridia bacterium]|nr:alpha/beta fold hydrolase [Clostridia bacterium]
MILAGEKAIYGRIWFPVTDGKRPAVILSHGYNGCHSDFGAECRTFAQHGFIAYSFDFCGGSTRSRSTGKSTDMTLFTEKQDLLDVFDHISAMEQVDEASVFVLGGSQGGIVTALAAEERAEQLRGMILYFPAFNIPDDWRNRFGPVETIPETYEFWGLTLGRNFFAAMKDFVPYNHIGGFKGPVLILQGDKDGIVAPSVAWRASRKYENAELVILKGEGHGFSAEGTKTAIEKALQMMQSSMQTNDTTKGGQSQ